MRPFPLFHEYAIIKSMKASDYLDKKKDKYAHEIFSCSEALESLDKQDSQIMWDRFHKILKALKQEVNEQAKKGFFRIKFNLDLNLDNMLDYEVHEVFKAVFKGKSAEFVSDPYNKKEYIIITLDLPERFKE